MKYARDIWFSSLARGHGAGTHGGPCPCGRSFGEAHYTLPSRREKKPSVYVDGHTQTQNTAHRAHFEGRR